MRALVINLDRSPDRLAAFEAEAARCGLVFTRMAAVDGAKLSAKDVAAVRSPRFRFQPAGPGEVATFMSHRAAWRMAADGPGEWTAIFEDDVRLADDIAAVLTAIDTRGPDGDIIRLETTLRRVVIDEAGWPLMPGRGLHRVWSWHGGMAGYVVNRDGAARLLTMTEAIADPVDQVVFNPLSPVFRRLNIQQVVPGAVVQEHIIEPDAEGAGAVSTVGRHETGAPRRGARHGILVELRRLGLKVVERSLRAYDRRLPGRTYRLIPFAATAVGGE